MFGITVDKGVVFGGVWDADLSNYAVRAYRVSDGSLMWGRQGQISGGADVSAGGRIFVFGEGLPGGTIDITTGQPAWSSEAVCDNPVGASPDGTKFYVRCGPGDALQAVDSATGKVLASFPDHGSTFGFATDGERIYMRTYSPEGVIAIDAFDGRKLWSTTLGDRGPFMFSVAGGVLYGLRGYGFPVAAMNAATGKLISLDARTSDITGQPMVANGRLYAMTGSAVTVFAP
jgi:outer membrane protein assembly factor BamB